MNAPLQVSAVDAVRIGATSLTRYGRLFFPRTFRQDSPPFHEDIGNALYNPANRQVAIEVHRDGAKTTLLRTFTSQRIAYGISRTILFVSASQGHSILSLRWIKRQVETNVFWAQTFKLRRGGKWADDVVEIYHGTDEVPITLLALGITGQLRGFNIDDYRPDLIVCDDSSTDEMTATAEQRKKYEGIFFGALANSLSPASESPDAKIVLLDTPKSKFDLIESCMRDPDWRGLRFGVFDEKGESRWPTRYPTETLLRAKASAIRTGKLAIWMREKECKIVSEELMSFRAENLRMIEELPKKMTTLISIDPASADNPNSDDNVVMAVGFHKADVYVLDYEAETGQTPEMVAKVVFEYIRRFRPIGIAVESVSYQRVLAWYLEQQMRAKRIYLPVYQIQDRRRKADRIVQAIGEVSGTGRLYAREKQKKLIEQYTEYSPTSGNHDDVLDALAMAIAWGDERNIEDWIDGEFEVVEDEDTYPKLNFRSAP